MNSILITQNGPLECIGELDLIKADGSILAHEQQTWLCRCGRSQDKPYCDGSHKTTGFQDDSAPASLTAPTALDPATPVRVMLRPNGPLKLEGSVRISHPVAGVIFAGIETALCRCGQSKKKPFCDGTHRQVGFIA
jgi:CDGSH-type Zn-finger protein